VGFVVLEGPLIQRLVGMLLGEDPKTTNDDYAMRPLTELDLRFLRRICDDIVQNLVRACTMHPRPEPIIELVVPNPRSAPSLPKTTTVVDVTIDFGPPHEPFGLASIVLPAQAEGVLWPAKSERRPTPGALLRPDEGIDRVMPVSVEIVAELTRKKLPLSDVRKLHVGQILELGPLRDVELRLSGQTAFTAEAGERDGVRSVRIRKKVPRLPV
jgi:flagellar motor switch protein FliM